MSGLARSTFPQPDGRQVILYGSFTPPPAGYQAPERTGGVWQQRWHPLRREWVLVASGRQARTFLPERGHCPLCPSADGRSTEVPASRFEVAVFENRFPALRPAAPMDSAERTASQTAFRIRPSAGTAEVVVYTDSHDGSFATLPTARIAQLVEVWTDRYRELIQRRDVRYVFIFENRGEVVGVTLHHPHGQILAYPFVPPVPDAELRSGRAFGRRTGGCLQCALIAEERRDPRRMLFQDAGIAAYVPAYARWPYEVHVAPFAHRGALPDLPPAIRPKFGEALQRVAATFDRLFGAPMPYMMAIHQRPTGAESNAQAHLHAEYYPVLRDAGKLKYLASSESAAGAFLNDTLAEESAARLRQALPS